MWYFGNWNSGENSKQTKYFLENCDFSFSQTHIERNPRHPEPLYLDYWSLQRGCLFNFLFDKKMLWIQECSRKEIHIIQAVKLYIVITSIESQKGMNVFFLHCVPESMVTGPLRFTTGDCWTALASGSQPSIMQYCIHAKEFSFVCLSECMYVCLKGYSELSSLITYKLWTLNIFGESRELCWDVCRSNEKKIIPPGSDDCTSNSFCSNSFNLYYYDKFHTFPLVSSSHRFVKEIWFFLFFF